MIEVADGVLVATSRVMSTTSTVLCRDGEALLIDPAWKPDELDAIADELDARGLRVIGGFATHAHHDHLLWHPRFGSAPRWASAATAALARDEREVLVAALGAEFPEPLVDLMGVVEEVDAALPPSSVPRGFAPELVVHDGHAPGHTAVWLPEQRVLIAGDMLSDLELPLPFDPDDLPAYLAALDLLEPYVAQADVVIPGHGTPGSDAVARLDADRRYLDDVVAGRVPSDPRLANPGMPDEYAHLKAMVADAGS
ncbi:glyoxylase-like metal-dependent hydrolase (beta-lactamase superfamily II) [Microbacterium trichothecenolyticum]|uniref:MBL fold metallo-hydrolase n=1 Tax=Microbacterium trichothecenolyticum TaxID=69370 RepID=UPI00285EE481|nr:MBL fold metallo-hydrolase [Microbacterium trichothecenolyticum]MDR7183528.1 glyoxylase-like metal-dependent hydrolase (beta-lactamase superfamily II) [Microbacterium trichothecenolyticum]